MRRLSWPLGAYVASACMLQHRSRAASAVASQSPCMSRARVQPEAAAALLQWPCLSVLSGCGPVGGRAHRCVMLQCMPPVLLGGAVIGHPLTAITALAQRW